jgi:hypothetical protein
MASHAREFVEDVARELDNLEIAESHALVIARSIGWAVEDGYSKSEVRYVAGRIRHVLQVPPPEQSDDSGTGA